MNIPRIIRRARIILFDKRFKDARRRERFLTNILGTRSFSRQSAPDKILALGRLMMVFERDFGYIPKRIQRTFSELNDKINHELTRRFADWK
jgi:hypothetical protein